MLQRIQRKGGAAKGSFPTEPLIHNDSEGILIAGPSRFPIELFRGHIGWSARDIL